jgi:putative phosphoribosyl transferase
MSSLASTQSNERQVVIPAGRVMLMGSVEIPPEPKGIVIFAHGTGSNRFSRRNRAVAQELRRRRLGTLLFDLLTDGEVSAPSRIFDIELLAGRLGHATMWAHDHLDIDRLPFGYFGASTGVAATLVETARGDHRPGAIVSRGGRPDLAKRYLAQVTAPTLLIVGGADNATLELNHSVQAQLSGLTKLAIIPGATHLFQEPGALDRVADLAAGWFETYLLSPSRARTGSRG